MRNKFEQKIDVIKPNFLPGPYLFQKNVKLKTDLNLIIFCFIDSNHTINISLPLIHLLTIHLKFRVD